MKDLDDHKKIAVLMDADNAQCSKMKAILEGWATVAIAGSFIQRAAPDFDPRSYGATKLTEVIAKLGKEFEMTKTHKGKGSTKMAAYKPNATA